MKLSIIICVYNTPISFLTECIDSISRSTIKTLGNDYEICMVDDGSTLDYSELIEKYNLRVTKTENRGILSARKTGAEMARGEYSIYCDSDDTVSFNYYLPMLNKALEEDADMVVNGWSSHTVRARYYAKNDETMCRDLSLSGDETLLAFFKNEGRQHSFFVLWNKIYKTDLLISAFNSLMASGIDPRTSYSEDAALNFFMWRDAKKVVNVHTGFYFYRIHPTQTVVASSEKKLLSQVEAMTKTLQLMRNKIGDNKYKADILKHIDEWAALMARSHYSSAKAGGYTNSFNIIKEKYGVEKLKLSTVKDGSCYEHKILLGENFPDVDRVLLEIYDSKSPVRVEYSKKDGYTVGAVEYLRNIGKISDDPSLPLVKIPKFKIRFKKRLIHNYVVQRIGLILFKKGSKSREFFKKFL